ncbi:hypothetical protein BGW39_011568 [Mortierella sp. 14UC]|nr:hypothetical protein BGW39_011568 [Mortierella sp. 14UC]
MKITLALSALVALAATAVSAAPSASIASVLPAAPLSAVPSNTTLSARADCLSITLYYSRKAFKDGEENPESDTHSFELQVADRYRLKMPFKTNTSSKSKDWRETRKSSDGLWKVNHNGDQRKYITLTTKGKTYRWDKWNYFDMPDGIRRWHYWHCIDWY